MTIQPVSPAMKVTFEMSMPRTWYTPSVTSKRPATLLRRPWRQRLGFTVAGASGTSRNAYASRSHTACPNRPSTCRGAAGAISPLEASAKSVDDIDSRAARTSA